LGALGQAFLPADRFIWWPKAGNSIADLWLSCRNTNAAKWRPLRLRSPAWSATMSSETSSPRCSAPATCSSSSKCCTSLALFCPPRWRLCLICCR